MHSWLGCLRPRALENLEQALLHAFAGHILRDGRVLAFAGDLVDLVDVDDAAFSLLDVVVGCFEQTHEDVFDVFADVAGFGQCRRVGDRERNAEGLGKRLHEVSLAGAGGSDHQNIALLKLDIGIGYAVDTLVVVVDGHGDRFFGAVLADDVLVEELYDLAGLLSLSLMKLRMARSSSAWLRRVRMSWDDLMQSSQMMAPPPPMKRLPDDLGLPQNRHLGSLSVISASFLSYVCRCCAASAAGLRGLAPRFAGPRGRGCYGAPRLADVDDLPKSVILH